MSRKRQKMMTDEEALNHVLADDDSDHDDLELDSEDSEDDGIDFGNGDEEDMDTTTSDYEGKLTILFVVLSLELARNRAFV